MTSLGAALERKKLQETKVSNVLNRESSEELVHKVAKPVANEARSENLSQNTTSVNLKYLIEVRDNGPVNIY